MRKATGKGTIQILNPRGTPPPITRIPMAVRPDSLDGKTIYIVDVNFPLTEPFYKAAAKLLSEKLPKVNWVVKRKVGSFFEDDPALWAEIKRKAHGAIVGPGHMDTLGPAVVGWSAMLEKMGVPARWAPSTRRTPSSAAPGRSSPKTWEAAAEGRV